jgi:hypothetical protein
MNEELKEKLAAFQHTQWSGWMGYLFGKGKKIRGGDFLILSYEAERWHRQAMTKYDRLPEEEKKSDRVEADKLLAFLDFEGYVVVKKDSSLTRKYIDPQAEEDIKKMARGNQWWCCGAEFGKHNKGCKNYKEEAK